MTTIKGLAIGIYNLCYVQRESDYAKKVQNLCCLSTTHYKPNLKPSSHILQGLLNQIRHIIKKPAFYCLK